MTINTRPQAKPVPLAALFVLVLVLLLPKTKITGLLG
jgi:hypothetical protein